MEVTGGLGWVSGVALLATHQMQLTRRSASSTNEAARSRQKQRCPASRPDTENLSPKGVP